MGISISKEMEQKLNKLLDNIIQYDKLYKQNHYDNFTFYNEYKNLCEFFITPIAIIDCNLNDNKILNTDLLRIRNEFVKEFAMVLKRRKINLGIISALSKVPFYQNFNSIVKKGDYSLEKMQLLQQLINVYNINICKASNNKKESKRILEYYGYKLKEFQNYKYRSNKIKQKVLSLN